MIKELKQIEGVTVTDLQHAYRINGVVDVWKNNKTIYNIVENLYLNETDDQKRLYIVKEILGKHPKRNAFKKTGKGRVSYQEFINNLRNSSK